MDPRFWPGGMGGGMGAGMGRGMGMPVMGLPNMQQPFYPPQGFQHPYLQQQQAQAHAQAQAQAQQQQQYQEAYAQAQAQAQQQQASPSPLASPPPPKDSKYPRFVNPFQDEKPQGSYGKREYVPGQEAIRIPPGHRGDDPWTNWHMMQARRQLQEMRRSW